MKRNDDIPRLEAEEKIKIDIDFEELEIKKRRRFPFFAFLLLILLAISAFFILKMAQNEKEEGAMPSVNVIASEDTWHGAFESREIFEACRESAVAVIAEGRRCSGFVYSADGWIATVEGVVNENLKGQIEVVLFDGRRFFVEAFRQSRESGLVLMKINANGLCAAELGGEGEIAVGEELYSFCSVGEVTEGNSLFSGRVAHTQRNVELFRTDGGTRNLMLFQIGILLTEQGAGAPLFNSSGELVGIAFAGREQGSDERYMIDYAFAFRNVKKLLDAMKSGKRAGDDELFSVIAE